MDVAAAVGAHVDGLHPDVRRWAVRQPGSKRRTVINATLDALPAELRDAVIGVPVEQRCAVLAAVQQSLWPDDEDTFVDVTDLITIDPAEVAR